MQLDNEDAGDLICVMGEAAKEIVRRSLAQVKEQGIKPPSEEATFSITLVMNEMRITIESGPAVEADNAIAFAMAKAKFNPTGD